MTTIPPTTPPTIGPTSLFLLTMTVTVGFELPIDDAVTFGDMNVPEEVVEGAVLCSGVDIEPLDVGDEVEGDKTVDEIVVSCDADEVMGPADDDVVIVDTIVNRPE
jgi:hypothetical protein